MSGRHVTFNPGPSELLPGVAEDVAEALAEGVLSISHRSEAFSRIFRDAAEGVARLLQLPADHEVLFCASATDGMEAAVRNLSRQATAHACFGAFSRRFRDVAATLGRSAEMRERPDGEGFDLAELDFAPAELATLTHVETSTGVELDLTDLQAFRDRDAGRLVAVDVVSSVPTRRMPWAAADLWIFSVQKGFGLPAGLGVMIVGPRARERSEALEAEGRDLGFVRRFPSLRARAAKGQTVETPNVLDLFLLGRACRRLEEGGGLDVLERTTREKAQVLDAWLAAHDTLRPFVREPRRRARTVAVAELPAGSDATALRDAVARHGLVLGAGYGVHRDRHVRIANFPALRSEDHERLIEAVDRALGNVHGAGGRA